VGEVRVCNEEGLDEEGVKKRRVCGVGVVDDVGGMKGNGMVWILVGGGAAWVLSLPFVDFELPFSSDGEGDG
jgi:hypothetical protein